MVYGIELTKPVTEVAGIEIRKGAVGDVVEFYGSSSSSCYYKGGPATVYGFVYSDGDDSQVGYWFKRKSDAVIAAKWVSDNNWDGKGDLEMFLQGENPDIGKCWF